MTSFTVQIGGFVDGQFPGFVECALVDAAGLRHEFVEKVPVVSAVNLSSDSVYPQPGYIGCVIEYERIDELGRRLICVDTTKPWSIESVAGETRFTVLDQQIVRS